MTNEGPTCETNDSTQKYYPVICPPVQSTETATALIPKQGRIVRKLVVLILKIDKAFFMPEKENNNQIDRGV